MPDGTRHSLRADLLLLVLVPALVGCTEAAPGSQPSRLASPGSTASAASVPSAAQSPGGSPETPSSRPTEVAPTPAGTSVLVNCGDRGRAFPADALSDPGTAELGTDAAVAVLRTTIADAPAETPFPAHGWHRVLDDATGAWFVAAGVDETQWWQVNVGVLGGVLQATEYGACHLSVAAPDGVSFARWWLDPAAGASSPDSTRVSILVQETACASGQSPEGRILPPTIVVRDDAIEVTIAIRHRPGGQDCQGNPASPMRLILPVAVGSRQVVDASWYPPRLVTTHDPG